MALINSDLVKIAEMFKKILHTEFSNVSEFKDLKHDVNEIKLRISNIEDHVTGIRKELDTEHEFRYKQLEANTEQLQLHKVRISKLENNSN